MKKNIISTPDTIPQCLGIDGCRSGWVVAVVTEKNLLLEVHSCLMDIWERYKSVKRVFIDMPIGFVTDGPNGRHCDQIARKKLSPYRQSSVFTPPCRAALYASLDQASEVNFLHTGKKLSRQTINIIPKMKELDEFLQQLPSQQRDIFMEAHPELIFWAFNWAQPLLDSKKTAAGRARRIHLLKNHYSKVESVFQSALANSLRKEVQADDFIDAMALGLAARLGHHFPDRQQQIPKEPPRDEQGFLMRMVYVEG